MRLCDRLEYALKIRDMTQRQLAHLTGITEATISRYVRGDRQPKADAIYSICKVLNISADWLIGLMEDKNERV